MESQEGQPPASVAQGHLFGGQHQNEDADASAGKPPSSESDQWPGEKLAVQEIVTESRKLAAAFQALTVLKPGHPDTLDKLEQALARLPSGHSLGEAVEALRVKGTAVAARGRRERVQTFRRTETEFINKTRSAGEYVREVTDGWRFGPLELQVRPDQAQCRALYNREVITDWTRVSGTDDIERLISRSREQLEKLLLPESTITDSFWAAYDDCRRRRRADGKGNPDLVPLPDFYRELRLVLARDDLVHKPDKRFSYPEFPKWAFLHNLDVYLRRSSLLPIDKRLRTETGSQQETGRIGVVVNGLDPKQDYKRVCFVRQG